MADESSTSAVSEAATDPDLEHKAAEQTKGSSKTARKTRKSSEIFGLGKGITTADSVITGSRLPTCKQVLRCYLFHQQQGLASRQTKYETATLVFNQVAEFYNKAHIPMMAETKAINKIVQLADANARIRAIPISRRTTPATCDKLQQEESRLNKTFEIWPPNVDELVTIPEDCLFLESMKTDRSATFGDTVLAAQTRRIVESAAAEARRKDKAQQQMDEASTTVFPLRF